MFMSQNSRYKIRFSLRWGKKEYKQEIFAFGSAEKTTFCASFFWVNSSVWSILLYRMFGKVYKEKTEIVCSENDVVLYSQATTNWPRRISPWFVKECSISIHVQDVSERWSFTGSVELPFFRFGYLECRGSFTNQNSMNWFCATYLVSDWIHITVFDNSISLIRLSRATASHKCFLVLIVKVFIPQISLSKSDETILAQIWNYQGNNLFKMKP